MSVDATRHAWRRQGLRPAAKLVFLAMADRAGEDHVCWPSIDRLVLDTGLNRKTVIGALAALVTAGEIADTGVRSGKTKQVVCYRIVGVSGREDEAAPKQYRKRNSTERGTVPEKEPSPKRNGSESGTVPKTEQDQKRNSTGNSGKQSQKRTGNSTENGTQNLKGEPTKEPPTYCRSGDRPHAPEGGALPPVGDRVFLTRKRRELRGMRLAWFEAFWTAFDYKHGKAAAADAWLDIPQMNNAVCQRIVLAAKRAAEARPAQERAGQTPKWAQGWIAERRWEDEHGPATPPAAEARGQNDAYVAMLDRMRANNAQPGSGPGGAADGQGQEGTALCG